MTEETKDNAQLGFIWLSVISVFSCILLIGDASVWSVIMTILLSATSFFIGAIWADRYHQREQEKRRIKGP